MQAQPQNQHQVAQQQLTDLLQREIAAVNKLLHSLEQEYAALADNHTAALETVVQEKQNEIRELELIGKQRESLMTTLRGGKKLSADNDAAFKDNSELAALWHELVALAGQCRDKNRINGSIVDTVSRQSRQALDVLHGITPQLSSAIGLYDQFGHATISSEKRSLTQV
jgi:flagellar biosynthesis/type III secretory pathway chaperone